MLSNAETRALLRPLRPRGRLGTAAAERARLPERQHRGHLLDAVRGGPVRRRRRPPSGAGRWPAQTRRRTSSSTSSRRRSGRARRSWSRCSRPATTATAPAPSRPRSPPAARPASGQGHVQQVARTMFGQMVRTSPCPTCRGRGMRRREPLPHVPRPGQAARAPHGLGRHPRRRGERPARARGRAGPRRRARGARRQPLRARGRARRPALRARRRRPHLRGRPDHDPGRAGLRGRGADAGGLGADRVQARHPARRGAGAAQPRRPGAARRPARRHQGAGQRARAAAPRRGPAARGGAARRDAGRQGLRRPAGRPAGPAAALAPCRLSRTPSRASCATPCACRRRRPRRRWSCCSTRSRTAWRRSGSAISWSSRATCRPA